MNRRLRITLAVPTLLVLRLTELAGELTAFLAGIAFDRVSEWMGDRA